MLYYVQYIIIITVYYITLYNNVTLCYNIYIVI